MTASSAHRADFQRNEQRIFDAAAQVLADDPTAGMADIAGRAELGRATLYRHFATRETLIEAVRRVSDDAAGAIVERHTALDLPDAPIVSLQRIVEELMDVGDRYRFLLAHPSPDQTDRDLRRARYGPAVIALIVRAQEADEIDPSADPNWVLMTFGCLIEAGLKALSHGRLDVSGAKRFVMRGLLDGYGPR